MKTHCVRILRLAFVLMGGVSAYATNYYINNTTGSDANSGTSSISPWSTFNNVNSRTFSAGDTINLACGCTWNQEMDLVGTGTSTNGITLTSYGSGNRPAIIRDGLSQGSLNAKTERCVVLTNPDYWTIKNLEVGYAGVGIIVEFTTISHQGLNFNNIYAHHCAGLQQGAGNGNFEYLSHSAGIAVCGNPTLTSAQYAINGMTFSNIEGTHNGDTIHVGITYGTVSDGGDGHTIAQNISCWNLYMHGDDANGVSNDCADGFVWENAENITIQDSVFDGEAAGYVSTGTTAIYIAQVQNLNFLNCMVTNTPNSGSNDMCGWDNEGFTTNINYAGDYFAGNAGAGIEFLAIHGSTSQDASNQVYSTLFVNNGTVGPGHVSDGCIAQIGSNVTPTGTVQNNLYWDPVGFNPVGSWSGFTISNNLEADAPANCYNAGNGFSNAQGANQWSYQLQSGGTWANMATFNNYTPSVWGSWGANNNTALIWQQSMLPDSTNADWTARAWTAPLTGTVSLRGWVATVLGQSGGHGVLVQITKNGTAIWGGQSGTYVAPSNTTGFSTNVDVAVTAGDVIRFAANDNGASNNAGDIISWSPNIVYTYSVPVTSTPPTLSNAGFEAPATTSYVYGPFTNGWTFGANAGVQTNGSGWGAPTAPQGTQTAFLQGPANNAAVSQALTFAAGTYNLSFQAAQRGTGGLQSVTVTVDGANTVGSWSTVSSAFSPRTTGNFTVPAGSHTITIMGLNLGDCTAFIDQTAVNSAFPVPANASFEAPVTSGITYGPMTNSWTFGSNAGVQKNGSAFGAPTAPQGTQTAFVQGNASGGATISQSVTLPAGSYMISVMAAQRTTYGGAQSVAVLVDSTQVGSWSSIPGSFTQLITSSFTVTAGSHTITIQGLNSGDNTAFIDTLSIIAL